jgi:membrane associated rhomboid family serine protease
VYFFYYIPLGINAKIERFPVMTAAYSVICAAVFVLVRYFPDLQGFDFYNLIYVPENANPVASVGSAFLHFGFMHLLGNVLYLVLLGRYVEDRMGALLFTFLYLSSAWIGNYAQGLYNIHVLGDPAIGIIGASGAIAGLLGAFSVRFLRNRLRLAYWAFMPLQAFTRGGTVEIPAIFAIALWFILQVARGLVQAETASAQVAYVSHIGGFVWGMALAIALGEHRRGKVESLLRKGQSYMRRGEPYAAQGSFIRYLSFRPNDARVYAELARAMVLSGNHAGAVKNYRQACEMLLDQQQRGEAEAVFQEALRENSSFALDCDHQLSLAFGLERNLKPRLAVAAYENFEQRYPQHPEAPFALLRAAGLHWNTLSNPARADGLYRHLVAEYPGDQWVEFAREQIRCLELERGEA